MNVFNHPEFANHESVHFVHDQASGLSAIIAIHNTNRGPALGGMRMPGYKNSDEALTDVLRLSRAMTHKAAIADLPLGGGKSVILGDPKTAKTEGLFRAIGRFIESLGGRYITAEDMNVSVSDCKIIAQETAHVSGIAADTPSGGDPSPMTAEGVFQASQAAMLERFHDRSLSGKLILVEGIGKVGWPLAQKFVHAGAKVYVTDIDPERIERAIAELGVTRAPDNILFEQGKLDMYAPCARGAAVNTENVARIEAKIVCGSANNILEKPEHGEILRQRKIVYVPDYVANCGGLIDVFYQDHGYDTTKVLAHVHRVAYERTLEILYLATKLDHSTNAVADAIAESHFLRKS